MAFPVQAMPKLGSNMNADTYMDLDGFTMVKVCAKSHIWMYFVTNIKIHIHGSWWQQPVKKKIVSVKIIRVVNIQTQTALNFSW